MALECCKAEAAQKSLRQRAVLLLGQLQAAAMEGSVRAVTAAAERRSGELQQTLSAVQQELSAVKAQLGSVQQTEAARVASQSAALQRAALRCSMSPPVCWGGSGQWGGVTSSVCSCSL